MLFSFNKSASELLMPVNTSLFFCKIDTRFHLNLFIIATRPKFEKYSEGFVLKYKGYGFLEESRGEEFEKPI